MKVTYRVISDLTGNDLTDKEDWLLAPNGTLFYKRGDCLHTDECLQTIVTLEDD